jgi:adenylate cyclase
MSKLETFHPIPKHLSTADYIHLDRIRTEISSNTDQRAVTLAMLTLEVTFCMPIRVGDQLKGFFLFGDKESGLPYGKEDIEALKTLAQHTAAALEKFDIASRWTEESKQNQQISRILQQYMSPSIADEVLKRVDQNKSWKGERRYVTVLVSDLRGFTQIFETHAPEEVVESLNEYFAEMNDIIVSYGGTIDKFMGDAVLVVFGAPTPAPLTESRAIACAIEMQSALKSLNKRRQESGHFPLEMGIGISAGEVVAGNIGSDRRMQYTVIGDAVNVAARLQSLAQAGQILITTNVLEKVTETVQYRRLYPIRVRGKVQPVEVVEVLGFAEVQEAIDIGSADTLDLPIFRAGNDDGRSS